MGIFRRKRHDDIDEALLIDQENLFDTIVSKVENAPKPNVLTADEIIGETKDTETVTPPAVNPLDEVRKKMVARQEAAYEEKNDDFTPHFNIDVSFLEKEQEEMKEAHEEPQPKSEALPIQNTNDEEYLISDDEQEAEDDFISNDYQDAEDNFISNDYQEDQDEPTESILESCLPFILDGREEEGLPEEKPLYTLESVASILGEEESEAEETVEEPEEEVEAFEETIVFKAVDGENIPDISDIDTNAKVIAEPPINFTGTMSVFINDDMIGHTRDVDISNELFKKPTAEPTFEEVAEPDEYDDYEPEDEFVSIDDRKRIRLKLLKTRRSSFMRFSLSLLSLIVLSIFLLPAFSDMMTTFSVALTVFTLIALAVTFIVNIDIFKSLITLKGNRTSAETVIALSCIFALVGIIFSIINELDTQILFGLSLSVVLSLTFRNFWCLKRSQYMCSNFTLIAANSDKYGISLIDDAPTTFAMARRAIDGDVLIAAPRRTRNITDFIKNSTIDVDFDGKAKILFFIALVGSLLSGVAFGFYRDSLPVGITVASSISLLFAPLTSLACTTMPLSHAARHIGRYGAMISGVKTARQIEQANACVIDCSDLFPSGSIQLADMKILSENNLEEIIACACAITSYIKSPLASVFKKITETNSDVKIPVADSVKYEEKLGITGWVGDKRVFIGNRSLMIAHEVEIPDSAVDKKILSEGFFPVYLASDGKALALIVLRYVPSLTIAKELDRITAMGLTVLINNCDQNISEEMICDYFDLYGDSVKIMSGSGVHMYKTATNYTESLSSGAAVKKGAAAIASTVFAANRIPKAVSLLQIIHYVTIVLGIIIFGYAFFGSTSGYVTGIFIALYQFICFILGSIAYLFTKP